jgi:hypothetical protein
MNFDEAKLMSQQIDTADVVLHEPSGEKWLVAYVRGERLAWCGWPEGEAKLSDCALVEKAPPEAREKLLHELASISGSDSRKVMAQYILAKTETRPS